MLAFSFYGLCCGADAPIPAFWLLEVWNFGLGLHLFLPWLCFPLAPSRFSCFFRLVALFLFLLALACVLLCLYPLAGWRCCFEAWVDSCCWFCAPGRVPVRWLRYHSSLEVRLLLPLCADWGSFTLTSAAGVQLLLTPLVPGAGYGCLCMRVSPLHLWSACCCFVYFTPLGCCSTCLRAIYLLPTYCWSSRVLPCSTSHSLLLCVVWTCCCCCCCALLPFGSTLLTRWLYSRPPCLELILFMLFL